ncbi:MAG: GNAT family N-acetyltransferase [Planctomycetota bacterium]|nr:GNAT family N-acetyltransferase [Planctomycetota bacterium]
MAKMKKPPSARLAFHPLTPERWGDLEALFGERGACGGCWCMWWRMTRAEFEKKKGAPNKRAFRKIVRDGHEPGVLAYVDGEPAGWCAIAPREEYPSLNRSRVLKPIDEKPVWSITCFFVARPHRRSGLSVKLIEAAVQYARRGGAKIVEGYPVEPRKGAIPDAFAWTGLPAAFEKARFREVLRRSPTRPIMRRTLR